MSENIILSQLTSNGYQELYPKIVLQDKKYHVALCDLFLSNVTGIKSSSLNFNWQFSSHSPNVSNVIIPNNLITIINNNYHTIYKLTAEEQWQHIDWIALVGSSSGNILFDYDGNYFFVIITERISSTDMYSISLKQTKDFKTFETIQTYSENLRSVYFGDMFYHINKKVYFQIRYMDSNSNYKYYYCKLDKTKLIFTNLSEQFKWTCGLFDEYDYSLVSQTHSNNQLTLNKRNVLTNESTTIKIQSSADAVAQYCIPLFIENDLYLLLTNQQTNTNQTWYMRKNYVNCLVSHDNGNSFEEYHLDNVLDGIDLANIVVKYNEISSQWYLKNTQTNNIFKFTHGIFEKQTQEAPYFYYNFNSLIALNENMSLYNLPFRLSSSSVRQLCCVFAFSADLKTRSVSRIPFFTRLEAKQLQDIPFYAEGVFFIRPDGIVNIFNNKTNFNSGSEVVLWTINQVYVHEPLTGTVLTASIIP